MTSRRLSSRTTTACLRSEIRRCTRPCRAALPRQRVASGRSTPTTSWRTESSRRRVAWPPVAPRQRTYNSTSRSPRTEECWATVEHPRSIRLPSRPRWNHLGSATRPLAAR
uniref:(northern house mosquito) hypothetical protein n=1 Tax=Culex pipiens TaxID=7175 RepID=A0A8D8MH11_CULPI